MPICFLNSLRYDLALTAMLTAKLMTPTTNDMTTVMIYLTLSISIDPSPLVTQPRFQSLVYYMIKMCSYIT